MQLIGKTRKDIELLNFYLEASLQNINEKQKKTILFSLAEI
jgi:hypothetical protein